MAGGLLVSITITQIVTQSSLSRLRKGTEQSSITIIMNNRLQEMVNLAFELESKISNQRPAQLLRPGQGLKDSLARLEYNTGILANAGPDSTVASSLQKLTGFISKQVRLSFAIIGCSESRDEVLQKKLTDSLRKSHWGDSIYAYAISFQNGLERNLNRTSRDNILSATQLSLLNQLLAGVALMSVMVMATIIIRRQVRQLALIKDLEKARRVAQQLAETKDQFLANMSHEIRTPLNVINGFSKIVSNEFNSRGLNDYATIIALASENLMSVINDILDFAKIETGHLVLKKNSFSLANIIRESRLMFSHLASEKGLVLRSHIGEGVPAMVIGDEERLRQVLVNLLSNAIKFTKVGEVVLELECSELANNRVKTLITIRDTGVGIPADKMDLIFERFEQLDYSDARQQGGTGLGLAITRQLAKAMGGSIEVSSELDKGSVFIVQLEFEKSAETEPAVHQFPGGLFTDEDTLPDGLKGLRVLVAEDNKLNQKLVSTILERQGAYFQIAENGEEAVAMARHPGFDVILMDVQMPKMDGLVATRLIRKQTGFKIKVIAMTAHVLAGEREKCLEAGMDDYLPKPLSEDKLVNMLQPFIPRKQKENNTEKSLLLEDDEWINLPYLRTICGNDEQGIRSILGELRKQLPGEIATLEKCLENPTVEEIKRICHHFRSTLSSLYSDSPPVITLTELNELALQDAAAGKMKEKGKELVASLQELMKRPVMK